MDEWQHYCHGARRTLLVPANEQCDRCGLAAGEDHYFDRLEGWLGFGETNTPPAGVEGKCECGLSEVACRDPLRRSCPDGVPVVHPPVRGGISE